MITLDTHALLWWVSGDKRLSNKAAQSIADTRSSGSVVVVSSISTWEVSMLTSRGRLALSTSVESWLTLVAQVSGVRFVPVNNEIAIQSVNLRGEFHQDPADRMIVATALISGAPLVTADRRIQAYEHVETIW